MRIKEILKKFPIVVIIYESVVKISYGIVTKIKESDIYGRHTSICNGEKNKEKKFFLITSMLTGSQCGLYSTILVVASAYIDFAVKKGWIPVIDLGGRRGVNMPMLQDEDKFGTENPWEYYYKQPTTDISLEEVYQSKFVTDAWYWRKKVKILKWNTMFPTDEKTLKYWNSIITSYIRLTDDLEERIALERARIFKPDHKVLGVGIRAGLRAMAMSNLEIVNGHPKQPTCEELMDIVEEKMRLWECDCIFLACDDREYFNKFLLRWGAKCYYVERELQHYFENDEPVLEKKKALIEFENSTIREKNEKYIIETYLLAECNCCYSTKGGATVFAYFLNNGGYEHLEVYDDGLYKTKSSIGNSSCQRDPE